MDFFPHAIASTPDCLFVASFDLPWSTPPLYGMAAQNAIVLPSSVFSWQSQEQFYAVHIVTCQTRKRFVALDGQRWNGDAGIRSCQFRGTCCSNVDHQNYVTRCSAQLLSVVITLFVTVLLLPFPSAALSIANIAFYLLLLPFSILSQPLQRPALPNLLSCQLLTSISCVISLILAFHDVKNLLQIYFFFVVVLVFPILFLVSRRSFTLVADYLVILVKYIIIIIYYYCSCVFRVRCGFAHCCSYSTWQRSFLCLCKQMKCSSQASDAFLPTCYHVNARPSIRILVRPALEYASPVCDGCLKRDSVALKRIRLAVARAVLRCSRRDVSNTETLGRIGWPTIKWRRRHQKLSVLWDLLQQRGPPKLCDKVPRTAAQRCDHSLRNSSSPAIPLCRTFHRQNSFLPASLALFNSLPASATSCSSKPAFLSALDKYFLPDKFNFGLSWC